MIIQQFLSFYCPFYIFPSQCMYSWEVFDVYSQNLNFISRYAKSSNTSKVVYFSETSLDKCDASAFDTRLIILPNLKVSDWSFAHRSRRISPRALKIIILCKNPVWQTHWTLLLSMFTNKRKRVNLHLSILFIAFYRNVWFLYFIVFICQLLASMFPCFC